MVEQAAQHVARRFRGIGREGYGYRETSCSDGHHGASFEHRTVPLESAVLLGNEG